MSEKSDGFLQRSRVDMHPTRGAILELFAATASALSAREAAEMLGLPLSRVRYHIQVLESIDELRLVARKPRADGTEPFYAYR